MLKTLVRRKSASQTVLNLEDPTSWLSGNGDTKETKAMRLSAVNRCVEVRSDAMAVLPIYIYDQNTRQRLREHPLYRLLNIRPNQAMTPFDLRKYLEASRLNYGNAYVFILRDRYGTPEQLIPLHPENTWIQRETDGTVSYWTTMSVSGKTYHLDAIDVLHYKGYTLDGIEGISVLSRARTTLETAQAKETYENGFYARGGRPSGVLTVGTDLGGTVNKGPNAGMTKKDVLRREWERMYTGSGSFRTAVLDNGITYTPIGTKQSDAQFVESKELSIADIARFYGVPLHKLYTGKQSYNSNEANGIEFVTDTLAPSVACYEFEDSFKLLTLDEQEAGLEIRRNMMAYLRGDSASRGSWYEKMRNIGVYSVNDIAQLEDMPDVPGGDTRYASLNYVPLEDFQRLSTQRSGGNDNGGA